MTNKGNTTPNRGRGPAKGTGGRPKQGAKDMCPIRWTKKEIAWLRANRSLVREMSEKYPPKILE